MDENTYYYPIPEECLPKGTDEKEIRGYRLGKSTASAMQENFVPQLFNPASNHDEKVYLHPCENCGASMFTDRALAIEMRNRMRNKDLIIEVRVRCEEHGPIKYVQDNPKTTSRHFDWYQLRDVDVESIVETSTRI